MYIYYINICLSSPVAIAVYGTDILKEYLYFYFNSMSQLMSHN